VPSPSALSGHGSVERRKPEDVGLELATQLNLALRQWPCLQRDVEFVDDHPGRSELQPNVANTGGAPAPQRLGQGAQLLVKASAGVDVGVLGAPCGTDDIQETVDLCPILIKSESRSCPWLGFKHEQQGRVIRAVRGEAAKLMARVLLDPFHRGEGPIQAFQRRLVPAIGPGE